MTEDAPILVTGTSGYIALHVVRQLLDAGHAVRGTLRSPDREDELRGLLGQPSGSSQLTFRQADLMQDDGWEDAVAGCRLVVHTASPVPLRPPANEDELIAPARDGALRLLRAAAAADVERVVMTSSVAAVGSGRQRDRAGKLSETNWSDLDQPIDAYAKSKTIAERAAWDFVTAQPADRGLELATINPALVLGPPVATDHSPSVEVIRKLLAREMPACPRLGWSVVDVRDVAAAHIAALTAPAAAGHRYICAGPFLWIAEMADILAAHLADTGRRVPTRRLPDLLFRVAALFDPTLRLVVDDLGRRSDFDTTAIRRDLDWTPRPVSETINETADGLIAHGVV